MPLMQSKSTRLSSTSCMIMNRRYKKGRIGINGDNPTRPKLWRTNDQKGAQDYDECNLWRLRVDQILYRDVPSKPEVPQAKSDSTAINKNVNHTVSSSTPKESSKDAKSQRQGGDRHRRCTIDVLSPPSSKWGTATKPKVVDSFSKSVPITLSSTSGNNLNSLSKDLFKVVETIHRRNSEDKEPTKENETHSNSPRQGRYHTMKDQMDALMEARPKKEMPASTGEVVTPSSHGLKEQCHTQPLFDDSMSCSFLGMSLYLSTLSIDPQYTVWASAFDLAAKFQVPAKRNIRETSNR